ncbi:MAG: septation protein SepH, partial [Nocardioides sp.]|uniref:septation protein SepH n=1 Tax=Nocardioides sp. TaxID=35761 RepID=UPI0039E6FFA4
MLFVDETGREFALDVDDRLRAALPAASPRRSEPLVNESAKNPPSSLRPRDIQSRIRSGESAEQVAEAAGTSVEKIMAFAGPVLAEREHMAERAQKASVRRRAGEPAGTARTLGDAVAGHLGRLDLAPEVVTWDSYRRTDGRWKLIAHYETRARSGQAELSFDPAGNYVAIENDDARWLIGDRIEAPTPTAPPTTPPPTARADDLQAARERRAQADA